MFYTIYKYQGTGNDFVIIDNRTNSFPKNNTKLIAKLCNRRFGIGADGLILLENEKNADFRMIYYNADGNESSMCGNGGRCITAFAKKLDIIKNHAVFEAIDGKHHATIDENDVVSLQMKNVDTIVEKQNFVFLDTGSPHHIVLTNNLEKMDVKSEGALIRYSDLYGEKGTNVNFVQQLEGDKFSVRTYERGVEDETLSCGTGITAVAIAMNKLNKTDSNTIAVQTLGGELKVAFKRGENGYTDVYLSGVATYVFKAEIEW